MMNLTKFLLDRITEDEIAARDAFSGQVDPENGWGEDGRTVVPHVGIIHEDIQRAHVVMWDPTRVLAECKAKRAMVDFAETVGGMDSTLADEDYGFHDIEEKMMRTLAAIYAEHPDYQQKWKL